MSRKRWTVMFLAAAVALLGGTQVMAWSLKEAGEPYAGTTLHMLINHHTMYDFSKPYIPEFEKQSGIKVNVELLTRKTMNTKQEFELGSGTGAYDLMHTSTSKSSRYINAGWCTPLNDFMNDANLADPNYDYEDHAPAARNTFVYEDTVYGIPWSIESHIYCYRTDILEEYGFGEPPQTYEQLEKVSSTIYTPEVPAISMRAQPGHTLNTFLWVGFLWGFGGRWFDADLNPLIDSEAAVKATNFYCKLLQNWGPKGYRTYIHYDIRNDFQTGKLASYIDADGLTIGNNDPSKSSVVDKWAIAPLPVPPGGTYASAPYCHGMFIPYDSPNQEAAFLFLQWYTSKEMEMHRAFDGDGSVVDRQSIRFSPEWVEKYSANNFAEAANYSLEHTFAYVRPTWLPEYNEIGDRLGIAIQEVLIGEKEAKPALEEVNEEIYLYMRLGGYYKEGMKNPNTVGLE